MYVLIGGGVTPGWRTKPPDSSSSSGMHSLSSANCFTCPIPARVEKWGSRGTVAELWKHTCMHKGMNPQHWRRWTLTVRCGFVKKKDQFLNEIWALEEIHSGALYPPALTSRPGRWFSDPLIYLDSHFLASFCQCRSNVWKASVWSWVEGWCWSMCTYHAKVFTGVAKSQFPSQGSGFQNWKPCLNTDLKGVYPLYHSSVAVLI
jgi:hypothetical protein